MDSISNNECAPASSQTHLGGANYINGRDLLTHFANLTSQDRSKSKSPNSHSNPNSSNIPVTSCAGLYSAILSSQQQGVIDESSSFISPSRHLSEPSAAANRHSPVDDQMDCAARSCRTSPSASLKSFHRQAVATSPPLRPLDPYSSSTSHINNGSNNGSGSLDRPSSQHQPQSSVFSITQSGLQELMRKSGSVISAEEIKKANNTSQLYLLVPSNYPVIMAVGSDREKAATAAVNEATARNLLERFQLTSTATPTPPSQQRQQQQQPMPPQVEQLSHPQAQQNPLQNQSQSTVMLRAPRKNSTNIPPMLLQSLKDVVPSLAFRDILENTNNTTSSSSGVPQAPMGSGANPRPNSTSLPHLSSLAMAYRFPPTVSELGQSATSNAAVTVTTIPEERKKKSSLTEPSNAVAPAALLISPQSGSGAGGGVGGGPSLLLEDYRSVGAGEVKIKPPPPPQPPPAPSGQTPVETAAGPGGGLCSDGLINTPESNGSLFFSANDSPPTRNYMGRMGGGGGGVGNTQGGSQSGSDSKDIRRRVSHNEVERRRRDRINTWIAELYKLLPPEQQAKSQYQSKGVVLKRVCEYFQSYDSNLKALQEENAIFKQEVCRLTRENHILRNSLNAHFQQQQQQQQQHKAIATSSSGVSASATSATAVVVSCEDSKAPSPSKRTHYSTE